MQNAIEAIEAEVPYTQAKISILLAGKSLIITGRNGSGKTSLLLKLYEKLRLRTESDGYAKVPTWETRARQFKETMDSSPEGSSQYIEANNNYKVCRSNIDPYIALPNIKLIDELSFFKGVTNKSAIVDLFAANRQSRILDARSAQSLDYQQKIPVKQQDIGSDLEQHLVNLAARRAFAKTSDVENIDLVSRIDAWFKNFNENLRFLFEDESVHLEFNQNSFKFHISQSGKQSYTLQDLSSGFSSIFSVLSSLIMRAQYINGDPASLSGTVFIDEIDAHLHVSLQKKILPFLIGTFPNLQFIVTTHSPFVLTSVSNAAIFDMDKREQVEDLSKYSYEAVLEGLFQVGPSSFLLNQKIADLAALSSNEENFDEEAIRQLVGELSPNASDLDDESRYFLNHAEFLLKKNKMTK